MKVSVVVPFYNAEKTLEKCIQSLFDLNDAEVEIIVVDNASTDNSLKIAKGFEAKAGNKKYQVLSESKQGREYARNAGAQAASGDILAFTDSDCVINKEWTLQLKKGFEKHPECLAAAGRVKGYPPENHVQKFLSLFTLRAGIQVEKIFDSFDLLSGGFPGANIAFKNTAFHAAGGFEELPFGAGDFDLLAKIYKNKGKLVFLPQAVVEHQHRSTIQAMCRQSYMTGRAHAVLLRRHFPDSWICELPGKTFRGTASPFPVWLNFTSFDKKTLVGLILSGIWTGFIFILGAYFFYLMVQTARKGREEKLSIDIFEHLIFLGLLLAKSCSMTWGRLAGGIRYREFCL